MKNSFLSGAVILMAANAVSKILGAVLKIPLTYIIHEEGMAIYNTAFGVYVMFLTFVVSGIPFAVQKVTAAADAVGDRRKEYETVKITTKFLCALGLCGTVILWLCADFFAAAMKEPKAAEAMRTAAPAVFLVAWGTAAKSGFQGAGNMLPTAVSQVIEAFVKLAAGYCFAVLLIERGTEYAAAGAISGVTAGEIIATLILVIWYHIWIKSGYNDKKKSDSVDKKRLFGELTDIALPLFFMSVVSSALSVCDTSVLRFSLLKSGLSEEEARFIYGAYSGYAVTVLNLPSGLLATLGISIVPVISGAAACGDVKKIRYMTKFAVVLSFVCGVCATAGLCVLGEWILKFLFRNTYSVHMLRMAAPSVTFICIMQITSAIMQSMGVMWRPFISVITAAVIKLAASVFLAVLPQLNIYGAVIGTDIAYFVAAVMNLMFMCTYLNKNNFTAKYC